jgi:hypothetical protein
VNIRFPCPVCETPGRLSSDPHGPSDWQCPQCDHLVRLPAGGVAEDLPACALCGNPELYKKKDFPHALGMGILMAAFLASTVTYLFYKPRWTWAILLGSAAFDGLLYLWVRDVIVCYRCQAHYRGARPNPKHKPFELTVHERYRQERLRREQLQDGKATRGGPG